MIRLLLFIVAMVLAIILFPLFIIYKVIDSILGLLFDIAYGIDLIGNRVGREFFNDYFIKRNGYKFGNPKETISSVIGKNQKGKTLTTFGWIINVVLWLFDYKYWFKGGHSLNSIDENV